MTGITGRKYTLECAKFKSYYVCLLTDMSQTLGIFSPAKFQIKINFTLALPLLI